MQHDVLRLSQADTEEGEMSASFSAHPRPWTGTKFIEPGATGTVHLARGTFKVRWLGYSDGYAWVRPVDPKDYPKENPDSGEFVFMPDWVEWE